MSSGWAANLPGADQPDVNRGPTLAAVSVILTVSALTIVVLRVWSRVRILESFGADDWVMIATMVLSLTCMGDTLGQVAHGAGRHEAYLSAENIELGLKLNYVGQILFLWAPCLVKVSIGLFLLRVTPVVIYRRIVYAAVSFLIAWTLACSVTLLVQCKNLSVLWDSSVTTSCWSAEVVHALGWASAVVSISSDFFFAIFPIAMLWRLQMNVKRKLSLGGILSLGVFASAAGITKTVFIQNYSSNTDNLWNATDLTIWTTVELNVGIMAASLPCLRPLFKSRAHGTSGLASNMQYPMHTYGETPSEQRGSKYLQVHTITRVTGGGRRHEDMNSSEERIIEPSPDKESGVQKMMAFSVRSEAT